MNPRAAPPLSSFSARGSPGPEFRSKLRGIKPYLPVRRPRVAEALAEAQAEREGGIKHQKRSRLSLSGGEEIDSGPFCYIISFFLYF